MGTRDSDIRKSDVYSPAAGSATAKTSDRTRGKFLSMAGCLYHLALRRLFGGFFNPFTAMLISWAIPFIVVIWYFSFR
jgi:hypothetical protein